MLRVAKGPEVTEILRKSLPTAAIKPAIPKTRQFPQPWEAPNPEPRVSFDCAKRLQGVHLEAQLAEHVLQLDGVDGAALVLRFRAHSNEMVQLIQGKGARSCCALSLPTTFPKGPEMTC